MERSDNVAVWTPSRRPNICDCEFSACNTRRRSPASVAMQGIRLAMRRAVRVIRRWATWYRARSFCSRASASASAWRNPSERPSPVSASTEPEASPIGATLSWTTECTALTRRLFTGRNWSREHLRRRQSSGQSSIRFTIHPQWALAKTEMQSS
jgi:hypothetical protein